MENNVEQDLENRIVTNRENSRRGSIHLSAILLLGPSLVLPAAYGLNDAKGTPMPYKFGVCGTCLLPHAVTGIGIGNGARGRAIGGVIMSGIGAICELLSYAAGYAIGFLSDKV